jgi:DNA-binding NtrC family response regulator
MPDWAHCPASSRKPEVVGPESADCVFLTCFDSDFGFLVTLLRYSEIRLHPACTLDQADFLLTVTGAQVLLCDAVFLDGAWTDCVEMLTHFHPQVCLLLVAEEVDAPSVSDAVNRGVWAVYYKPLRSWQLLSLIRKASAAALNRAQEPPSNTGAHSRSMEKRT